MIVITSVAASAWENQWANIDGKDSTRMPDNRVVNVMELITVKPGSGSYS